MLVKPRMHNLLQPRSWLRHCVCVVLYCSLNISIAWSAEQDDLTTFLQDLQNSSDQVASFSSSFIQEKHLALFSQPVIFAGKLAIVRPDRLRWEFISPIPSVLLLSGDQGTRCNDQQQTEHFLLSSDPIMKTVAEQLWLWLGGDYKRLNGLYILEKKGESTLLIRPKDSQTAEFIAAVSISFNSTSFQPQLVEIFEPGGDLTRILFSDTVINPDLVDHIFTECSAHE